MPKKVDTPARRRAIADAALAVAAESGVAAVSFRRVADQLGSTATTSTVTHYVSNRADLLQLMFHRAFDRFVAISKPVLRVLPPRAALALLIEGALPLRKDTRLLARLWIELVMEVERQPELQHLVTEQQDWYLGEIHYCLRRLDFDGNMKASTELIATGLDGIALTALSESEAWPAKRQRRAANHLLTVIGVPTLRWSRDK